MKSRTSLAKVVGGAAVAGVLAAVSAFGGASDASAGTPSISEVVVTKATDAALGDTDGRDFLIWRRSPGNSAVLEEPAIGGFAVEAQDSASISDQKIAYQDLSFNDGVR